MRFRGVRFGSCTGDRVDASGVLDDDFCGRIVLHDREEMVMTEWGTGHEPDPDELVDFMTEEGCGPVRLPVVTPHPVPLHEPEEGLLDEEALGLFFGRVEGV